MADEFARLAIQVDATDPLKAVEALRKLGLSAETAEKAVASFKGTAAQTTTALGQTARAAETTSRTVDVANQRMATSVGALSLGRTPRDA